MRVDVRLFARYREAAGRDRIEIELPSGGTVEAAWGAVVSRHPELVPYRPFTLFAVGHEYVSSEHRLSPGDELCLFPPVSGGGESDTYRVVTHPLNPDSIAVAVDHPGAGGIAIFSGVVRNETGGRQVKFLEYEAHAPMAEAKMREIGEAIHQRRYGVNRVAMLHRLGRMEIAEPIVLLAVSAAHRAADFAPCQYAIDTLKSTVPVWKKEHFGDGEVWVGLQGG